MSKKARIIISCILVVIAFGAGIASYALAYGNRTEIANADGTIDYFVDEFGKIDVPEGGNSADAKKSRGQTADNPFFILEIVPYEGYAHFGYLIEGCEPADVEHMCWDNKAGDVYAASEIYTNGTKDYYYWDGEVPDGYTGTTAATTNQCGVMTFMGIGAGDYSRDEAYETAPVGYTGTLYVYDASTDTYTEDASGTFMRRDTFTKVADGDYAWEPLTLEECLALTEDEVNGYKYAAQEGTSFKACFDNVTYHYRLSVPSLEHKNTFLRESVGLAYTINAEGKREKLSDAEADAAVEQYKDNYVVYTVTPEDLNINLDLIDRADLIYFGLKEDTGAAERAYNWGYKKEKLFSRATLDSSVTDLGYNNSSATFQSNPISWEAAVRIYNRVNDSEKSCPVLFNSHIATNVKGDATQYVTLDAILSNGSTGTKGDNGTQNNLYKLYLMLYQMSNPTFLAMYGNPSTFSTTTVDSGLKDRYGNVLETGLLSQYTSANAKSYWTQFSLYPWNLLPSVESNEYYPILNLYGIMGDRSECVYQYGMPEGLNMLRNNMFLTMGGTNYNYGFSSNAYLQDNQYGADVYDFFESIGEPKTSLTTAECLYYMLNGLAADTTPTQIEYKVLELQPSPEYEEEINANFWNLFIATYANSTKPPVVTKMTTSEFIGKHVECLSEYDMVYIGVNKASNDVTMMATTDDGSFPFVYAHTGPTATIEKYTESSYVWPTGWVTTDKERTALFGWLGTGSSLSADDVDADLERQFALSGNDLTVAAKKELLEYATGGYPLVFGSGFFSNTAGTTVSSVIDLNSNIYKLTEEAGSANYIYKDSFTDNSLHISTKQKLQVALEKSQSNDWVMHTSPLIYNSEAGSDDAKYINGDGSGSKELKFEFTIDAPSTTTFSVDLYVDVNGDGKFVESENITNITTSVRCITDNNYVSATNGLRGGKRYRIVREVDDRVGAVSWKLDLVSNGKVYKSLSGVSAIKTSEKEQLRILQIISNERQTVYLPQDSEVTGGVVNISGASSTQLQVAQWFYDYTRNINGFDISFVRMTEDELLLKLKDNPDYLMQEDAGDFQMIVLGFADAYNGVTFVGGSGTEYEYDVLMALEDYRADGRAILFTHDTSSLVGDGDTNLTENHSWGADVTERFRASFGMDRYDAVAYRARTGETRGDYPYVTTANSSNIGKLLTTSDNTNYLLTQGMTNGCLYRFLYKQDGTSYKAMGWSGADGNLETNAISRVNKGGITEYPYTIPENITTAVTHTQYYQLDLEDQNIVVWYCLDEPKSSNENGASLTIKDFAQAYYKATPNDVRNNYYIYNIDNVTYSGMGHSGELTLSEVKLFINTFVAAYRAKAKPAEIFINNSDATKMAGGEKYLLCVDIDNSDASIAFGTDVVTGYQLTNDAGDTLLAMEDTGTDAVQAKRIYFTIKNNSTYGASGCEYTLKIYVEEDGEANPDNTTPLAVFRASDNVFMDGQDEDTKLTNDVEYYVDVPLTMETKIIDGESKDVIGTTEFMMSIFMEYGLEGDTTETIYTKADIVPRRLFMLD